MFYAVNAEDVNCLTMATISLVVAPATQFEIDNFFSLILFFNGGIDFRPGHLWSTYSSVVFCADHKNILNANLLAHLEWQFFNHYTIIFADFVLTI